MPPTTTTPRPSNQGHQVKSSRRGWIVAGAVVLILLVTAIVAVVATSGGSDDASDSYDGITFDTVVDEFMPVTVTGDPLPVYAEGSDDPALGLTAPALEGSSFDGTPVSVTPGEGGPYMLVFLAPWCPHCNAEIPRLIEWYQDGGVPEGLQVVGVVTNASDQAPNWPPSEWIQAKDWPWPAMADDRAASAYQAYGGRFFPTIVIVGEDGTVKQRVTGELSVTQLDEIVDNALNG